MASNIGSIPKPVYQSAEYTFAGATLKFLEEKTKDVAKIFGYSGYWIGKAAPSLAPSLEPFSSTMGNVKNFVSATEVPKKTKELTDAVSALWAKKTLQAGREVFKKTTGLINSAFDTIDLSSRFVPIGSSIMKQLKGVNLVATIGGAGNGALEQIQKLSKPEVDETSQKFYLINLVRDVSYVAGAAFALSSLVVATPAYFATLVMGCFTSGLTFTVTGYFYEKMHDPENKGKNLNSDIVMNNLLAREDYERKIAAGKA